MRNPVGIVLSDDLVFTSRIAGTARAHGFQVHSCRAVEVLVKQAGDTSAACVILDLHHAGLDLPALLDQLRQACPEMPRVVAYGAHVEAATLKAAREAGCDLVLPRSAFVKRLETDLPAWLEPSGEVGGGQ